MYNPNGRKPICYWAKYSFPNDGSNMLRWFAIWMDKIKKIKQRNHIYVVFFITKKMKNKNSCLRESKKKHHSNHLNIIRREKSVKYKKGVKSGKRGVCESGEVGYIKWPQQCIFGRVEAGLCIWLRFKLSISVISNK